MDLLDQLDGSRKESSRLRWGHHRAANRLDDVFIRGSGDALQRLPEELKGLKGPFVPRSSVAPWLIHDVQHFQKPFGAGAVSDGKSRL